MMTKTRKRINEVKGAIRNPYTWPGAYPLAFVAHDGCICRKCVTNNFRAVLSDIKSNAGGWNVAVDVLWEGEHYCADCGDQLETAYGPELVCEL